MISQVRGNECRVHPGLGAAGYCVAVQATPAVQSPMPTFTLTDAELRELRDRLEVWGTGFRAGLERHDPSSDQRRDDERWADALKNIRALLARADELGTFDPELTMRVLQKIENGSATFNGNEEPELWDYAQRLVGAGLFQWTRISDKLYMTRARSEEESASGLLLAVLRNWKRDDIFPANK